MYTIEYYKTKAKKPIIEKPEYSSENERINYMMKRAYLHQKNLNDECWNIKSLTIDVEDINHIVQDRNLGRLYGLYARVRRAVAFDETINSITILNNNSVNLMCIYEIINCKWMVNADEEINDLEVLKTTAKRLITLIDKYNAAKNSAREYEKFNTSHIKDEIELTKYYMDTIINKCRYKKENIRSLKLGNHFLWDKKRTID